MGSSNEDRIFVASYAITVASAVGAGLLLVEFARRPVLRRRTMLKPLFYESLAQFSRALGLLVEMGPLVFHREPVGVASPAFCALLGAVDQFTSVACYGWYSAIAFNAALVLAASPERPAFTHADRRIRVVRLEEKAVLLASVLACVPPLVQNTFGAIDDHNKYLKYDCWIRDDRRAPVGQVLNFVSFLVASAMGLVLVFMVIKHRHRVANFNDTFRQSLSFTSIFLTVWTLQHVDDFGTLLDKKPKPVVRGLWLAGGWRARLSKGPTPL